ncbi:nucleoside diphosphate kinase regulator [Vibrio diazotrophicus]|uniref:nucleoside diphosphate kinase regulator n=1 Tax=Vibrio diazotrophicus TaxID=685 RepID=UPI000C9DE758|nr:nucleoside diphosphate kinase regulator [Vibrio diazotrophicus]PNH77785.1 nucleoside diphosphate kinase regulator [Vibrio diazotrophicus]
MHTKPDIIISSLDLDRIYSVLETLPRDVYDTFSIKQLEGELERANIVSPESLPNDVVTMNSKVCFEIEHTNKNFELTLVYPQDMDKSASKVSILAPVGSALIGLSIGDSIDWIKPDGKTVKVTIKDITYQPERSGDLLL